MAVKSKTKTKTKRVIQLFDPQTMAVEISSKREETSKINGGYELFTVQVEDYKILSLCTGSDYLMKKWVSNVYKLFSKKKNENQPLVVGISVDREIQFNKEGMCENYYDTLTICSGTNSLVYSLPSEGYSYSSSSKSWKKKPSSPVDKVLRDLFADPKVIVVGKDMAIVCEKLEKDHLLKICQPVDANDFRLRFSKKMKSVSWLNAWYTLKCNFQYVMIKPREDPWIDDELYRLGYCGFKINKDHVETQTGIAFLANLIGEEYLKDIQKLLVFEAMMKKKIEEEIKKKALRKMKKQKIQKKKNNN